MTSRSSVFWTRRILALAALAALGVSASFAAPAEPPPGFTRVIVAFKPGAAGAARAAVNAAGGRVREDIFGMAAISVEVPERALAALERNPNVEYVEPDVKRYLLAVATPSDGTPYLEDQLVPYGIEMVQADLLASATGTARKVCIIDSGYDGLHEDLSHGAAVDGTSDTGGAGIWSVDDNGHGTHVAGTIAALNNGLGVVGVVPGGLIQLHIMKVFDADGWAYTSTLASAALKCELEGAKIISMSLGGSFSNKTEQRAFDGLLARGVLSIAAAGNGGNSRVSYPAGYASVVSVAAVDASGARASFSQYNKDVEIAAPGVGVLSTVPMGTGLASTLKVGTTDFEANEMEGSPLMSASGPLADFGLGLQAVAGTMTDKVCLIQRGTNNFADKVMNCQSSGGVGAVIYNNVAGSFVGTLGTTSTAIPSLSVSDTDGAILLKMTAQSAKATVSVAASNYAVFDGTSMATPHVSAVAALVWSQAPQCTASDVRNALNKSAKDLGKAGRDVYTGWGLVQANAAAELINSGTCGR